MELYDNGPLVMNRAPSLTCYVWSEFHNDSNRLHVPNYCTTLTKYDPLLLETLRNNLHRCDRGKKGQRNGMMPNLSYELTLK
jgi:hypothetical protein